MTKAGDFEGKLDAYRDALQAGLRHKGDTDSLKLTTKQAVLDDYAGVVADLNLADGMVRNYADKIKILESELSAAKANWENVCFLNRNLQSELAAAKADNERLRADLLWLCFGRNME